MIDENFEINNKKRFQIAIDIIRHNIEDFGKCKYEKSMTPAAYDTVNLGLVLDLIKFCSNQGNYEFDNKILNRAIQHSKEDYENNKMDTDNQR